MLSMRAASGDSGGPAFERRLNGSQWRPWALPPTGDRAETEWERMGTGAWPRAETGLRSTGDSLHHRRLQPCERRSVTPSCKPCASGLANVLWSVSGPQISIWECPRSPGAAYLWSDLHIISFDIHERSRVQAWVCPKYCEGKIKKSTGCN